MGLRREYFAINAGRSSWMKHNFLIPMIETDLMNKTLIAILALLTSFTTTAGVHEEREILARYKEYIAAAEKLLHEARFQVDESRRIKFNYHKAIQENRDQVLRIEHYFFDPTSDFDEFVKEQSKYDQQ